MITTLEKAIQKSMTPARRRASGGYRASVLEVLGVVPPGAINRGGHPGATLGGGGAVEVR